MTAVIGPYFHPFYNERGPPGIAAGRIIGSSRYAIPTAIIVAHPSAARCA